MDSSLLQFLNQNLIVYSYKSKKFHNEFVWDTFPYTYKCFIVEEDKMIRGTDQQESLSTCHIFLDLDAIITTKDKIILPNGRTPEILMIERPVDEYGDVYAICIYTR